MTKKNNDTKHLTVKTGIKTRTIHVDYLARVEGEGALYIKMEGNKAKEVQLKIFEPPRFFEALLRGRELWDAPDITSRICGICPVAYQMSAVSAIENALHIKMPDYLNELRRLMYCGEWIESHTLHVHMLHAPDFLGYDDAIAMSKDFPEVIKRGLRIKKAGNALITTVGGREVHPINIKVGGFYRLPEKKQLHQLLDSLKQARDDAEETVRWVSEFPFPDYERSYECVSLFHPTQYPMIADDIISTSSLHIPINDYDQHFTEQHIAYSTALFSHLEGKGSYFLGPLARYNLNHEKLSPIVQSIIKEIKFEKVCKNPFRSIIIRALEVLYALDEAIRIITAYNFESMPASLSIDKQVAVGYGASEAPRGLLYHRYHLDENGIIKEAKIVPPTSQNQKVIEEDLYQFVNENIGLSDQALTWKCEQAIRNYDPCISCAAHFLKLERVHE